MGEHKLDRAGLASAIGADMTDRGKLLEEGFEAMLKHMYPEGSVPEHQRRDLRMAWFLACDHLFFGVMGAMSDGARTTERDLARMAGVADEIEQFRLEVLGKSSPAPARRQ
jgi:hypothetical protein